MPEGVAVASIERFNEEEWQNLLLYYTHTARARFARVLRLPLPPHAAGCAQLCHPHLWCRQESAGCDSKACMRPPVEW